MSEPEVVSSEPVSEMVVSPAQAFGPIEKVTRLEVRFEVPGIESKKLYANGRMQVRVWVVVEAEDADGNNIPLPYFPDLISAKLIHYHDARPLATQVYTGKPLTGWNSSRIENKYAHELPGGFSPAAFSARQTGSRSEPLVFWISSSEVAQAQIAVEVTLQGEVYRSNNTTNPDGNKINKSILLYAEAVPSFAANQFRLVSDRVGGERSDEILYRYYLGLYPNERQIKLVSWRSDQYNPNNQYPVMFCNTGALNNIPGVKGFLGEFPQANAKKVYVSLPQNQYVVDVNQRSGELTFVQGISTKSFVASPIRVAPFYFTATDEYGNDHRLSIAINVNNTAFTLQKG